MRLVSFGRPGDERPGAVHNNTIIDLLKIRPSLPRSVRGILEAGALDVVADAVARPEAVPADARVDLDRTRLGPPVTDPSKIVCLGRNYRAHASEQGAEAPARPLLFAKGPNTLCGHHDEVPYPDEVEKLDYEVELAVVIGRRATKVSTDEAGGHVGGYTIMMDLTARDIQKGEGQWFRGKSFDRFAPTGPWLVTVDEIEDPQRLRISMDVGSERRQDSDTGQMTFGVDYLIHYISQTMTLEPGDIIATGTPSGVGAFFDPPRFLSRGDRLTARIERIGELTCTIV